MKTNNKTQETKPSNPKSKTAQKENTPFAESVVLKPVGYPFDFAMMENNLEIIDKTLFEEYAREQWLGLVVKENSYLFDQKIIPDYGFQIVSVIPNNSIIAENTEIKLLDIEEEIWILSSVLKQMSKFQILLVRKMLKIKPKF